MNDARRAWLRAEYWAAGQAIVTGLGDRQAHFVAEVLVHPPIALDREAVRKDVAAILRNPETWAQARPRFHALRNATAGRDPGPAVLLCETALKLAHNLSDPPRPLRFDPDQAARLVFRIGQLSGAEGPDPAIFDALWRARQVALNPTAR